MSNYWKLICVCGLILVGCDPASKEQEPIPVAKANPIGEPVASKPKSAIAGESAERMFGGVKFEVPSEWEEKSLSSSMLHAEFTLPGQAGNGRLTLSSAGGGTAANLDRWRGQFQRGPNDPEQKESSISTAGKEAAMIEVHGTFSDQFGGGGPKSDWQLLGVAIPIDADHNYFVKLTGPNETVNAHRDAFIKFVESARFEK